MKRVLSKPLVRYWLPALIMLFIIRLESTSSMGGSNTYRWLVAFYHWAGVDVTGQAAEDVNFLLRKSGHCIGYALLSFLSFRAMRGTYLFLHFGFAGWRSSRAWEALRQMGFRAVWQWPWALVGWSIAALTAVADEVHQMYLPGRSGTVQDMALDSTAALVAQVLTYFMAVWIAKRRGRNASVVISK